MRTCDDFENICKDLHEFARICVDLQRFAGICSELQRFVRICMDLHGFVRICEELHGFERIYTQLVPLCRCIAFNSKLCIVHAEKKLSRCKEVSRSLHFRRTLRCAMHAFAFKTAARPNEIDEVISIDKAT